MASVGEVRSSSTVPELTAPTVRQGAPIEPNRNPDAAWLEEFTSDGEKLIKSDVFLEMVGVALDGTPAVGESI